MDTADLCAWVRTLSRPQLMAISRSVGIPYSTLEAIKRARTTDPRGRTLDRLRAYREGNGQERRLSDFIFPEQKKED